MKVKKEGNIRKIIKRSNSENCVRKNRYTGENYSKSVVLELKTIDLVYFIFIFYFLFFLYFLLLIKGKEDKNVICYSHTSHTLM